MEQDHVDLQKPAGHRFRPPHLNHRPVRADPRQQVHLVAGRQGRPLPETRQARRQNDRVAGRRHPRPHRAFWGANFRGESATLSPAGQAAAHLQCQGSSQGHGRHARHHPALAQGWLARGGGLLPDNHPGVGPDRFPEAAQHQPEATMRTGTALLPALQGAAAAGLR
jgi:hypothetical protein